MQNDNRIVSDFVKFINSAAGTFAGVGREASEGAREKMREAFGGFDFVSREEFDAVKAMAAKAREEVEVLKARIAALEPKAAKPVAQKAAAKPAPKAAPKTTPAAKVAAAKVATAKPAPRKKA